MESFLDFEPRCSENRFPTPMELRKVKQMLLSGDKDQILQSVEIIKTFTHAEESLSEIIRSDIPEFLCDAVIPFDVDIVSALYSCLELMSSHVEFFTHNHSCFAIESLIRTLHFIMKDSSSSVSLNQCLNLLNIIVQGYNNYQVTPEKKTIENLLQLLPTLVKNMTPTVNSKYQTGTLISSLFELKILNHSQEAHDIILVNFCCWFNLLQEVLESEHPMREKLIFLCSMLSHFILRFLVSKEDLMEDYTFEISENLKSEIISNVTEFLINIGAPYVDSISLSSIENDPSLVESFYQGILCYYSDEIATEKSRLTHGLSEMGFLQFTTRIVSHSDFSHGQRLRRICLLTLFHIILYLSEDVFHFPQMWPKGREDFRSEIQHGIAQLPFDLSQWLDALIDPGASSSSKLAILLYLYFYTLTAKSQDILQEIYTPIVTFIRATSGIDSSVLHLKLVWFIFVMSQLSVAQNASPESEGEATDEMVSLLEAQGDLSLIYTHHPALLYWAFTSRVSTHIQTQTVHLWLRNKMPDCKELDELMRKSPDVRFAVLDIIQNGCGQELDSAFSSLKSLLNDSDDDLAASMWFLLPQVLAKFTAESTSAVNVDYVIELCSLRTPETLDMARVIRIASLLPEVFLKSNLISIMPSLSLTLQLLQVSTHLEDNRVLCVFLRHDGFIQRLLEGLHSCASDISVVCLKISNILWSECQNLKHAECRKRIRVRKDTILRILETNCEEVLSEGLDFLHLILLTGFRSPVFEVENPDLDFVEILFFQIQNICIKSTADIEDRCWRCLKLFLTVNPLGSDIPLNELVTHPLLHELILVNLLHSHSSHHFRDFLATWVELNKVTLGDPCFNGKLFGWFFADTMRKVEALMGEDEGSTGLRRSRGRRGFDA